MRRFSLDSEFSPSRRLFTKRLSAALFGAFVGGRRLFAQDAANKEASKNAASDAAPDAPSKPIYVRKGADPWILEFRGKYIWSQSNNPTRQIVLSIGDTPDKPGRPRPVWTAPEKGPYSRELWAPEIHFIDGRFYIYFAADDGDNKNHLTYVLVSENDDPFRNTASKGRFTPATTSKGKRTTVGRSTRRF
ncbi:MAG: family 43 glycosylhydrolase [Thermoguttaceae bacterium]|nr:family 43 glycosylhydrolase [Thermoguttaceae bacterium]